VDGTRIPVEELIEFPTTYVFKAIGRHTLPFAGRVLEVARGALGDEREIELRTRLSRQGAYVSVTLLTRLESADELRAVYAALRTVEGVITLL
jgi:putative lipoic acid-binding regulatory protein